VACPADEENSRCASLNFPSARDVIDADQHARCELVSLYHFRAKSMGNGSEPEIRLTAFGDELHFVYADITQQGDGYGTNNDTNGVPVTTTHPQVFENMVGPWGLEPQTSTVSR
jgi:hypothetical protein